MNSFWKRLNLIWKRSYSIYKKLNCNVKAALITIEIIRKANTYYTVSKFITSNRNQSLLSTLTYYKCGFIVRIASMKLRFCNCEYSECNRKRWSEVAAAMAVWFSLRIDRKLIESSAIVFRFVEFSKSTRFLVYFEWF